MSQLSLILADFHAGCAPAAGGALPRLAALELVLSLGSCAPLAGDWRQWMVRRVAGEAAVDAAPGGIVAAARGTGSGRQCWLAAPLHYVAGLDSLRLHPLGLLKLQAAEQSALAADFARVFQGSGWELHATNGRELLLAGDPQCQVRTSDPARWLGREPTDALPVGRDAAALRRLMSECEMWLHDHPVNQQRAARGELTISGLWPFGGGAVASVTARSDCRIVADDVLGAALALKAAQPPIPLPACWQEIHHRPGGETVIVRTLSGSSPADDLLRIDRDWVAPMLAQWRARQVQVLHVVTGERVITLDRAARWRWLRRTRPWWEVLGTC